MEVIFLSATQKAVVDICKESNKLLGNIPKITIGNSKLQLPWLNPTQMQGGQKFTKYMLFFFRLLFFKVIIHCHICIYVFS
jgi:hypothetical protein